MNLNVKKEGNLLIVEASVERRTSLRTQERVVLTTEDVVALLKERKDLPSDITFSSPGLQEIPLCQYCVILDADYVNNENPKALRGTWIFEVISPPPAVKKSTKKSTKKNQPSPMASAKKSAAVNKTKTKEDK